MEAQLGLLKQFLACVKANPSMMNSKELAFFKEFIERYSSSFYLTMTSIDSFEILLNFVCLGRYLPDVVGSCVHDFYY